MKIIVKNNFNEEYWDLNCVKANLETGLLQSTYWANVIEKLERGLPYYIICYENSKPVGFCLIIVRWFYRKIYGKKIFLLPYLECLDGPVILDESKFVEIYNYIIKEIKHIARKHFAVGIKITPAVTSKFVSSRLIDKILIKYGFSQREWATYLIDLNTLSDDLFSKFHKSAKKNIKKSKRLGLKMIKISNSNDFRELYWKTYCDSEKAYGRSVIPYADIWNLDKKPYYHYYIAKDKNNMNLACLGMNVFNGVAKEIASTITPYAIRNKIPAQDFLHWELIQEAKKMGCKYFDLAGVNPKAATNKEIGIKRFKSKWGGKYIEYNIYEKHYFAFNVLKENLSLVLNYHRK